jgi:hypothetical protein
VRVTKQLPEPSVHFEHLDIMTSDG